jgi:hypothetical protein
MNDRIKIGMWKINRVRFITLGPDPTEGCSYVIKNNIDCVLTVTELFDVWTSGDNTFLTAEDVDKYVTNIGTPSMTEIVDAFAEADNPLPKPVVGRAPYLPTEEHEKLLADGYTFRQEAEFCDDTGSAESGPSVQYSPPYDVYAKVMYDVGTHIFVEANGTRHEEDFDPRWED